MAANQWSCPGVWSDALGDPRDMAKARLPESQSPEDAMVHPPERCLKPVPPPAFARHAGERTPREEERFTVSEFKEMSGAPKSR
jgi:hypothetical protein